MDESAIERAEQHQEYLKQREIEKQRSKVPKGIGPKECDCGKKIHIKRRELGYHTCIGCAETQERINALLRR